MSRRVHILYLLPPLFKMKFLLAKVLWQSADRIIEEVCGMRLLLMMERDNRQQLDYLVNYRENLRMDLTTNLTKKMMITIAIPN